MKGRAKATVDKPPRSHEWLTQCAFILALALVAARATIPDFSKVRGEAAFSADTPRGPGAATALGLDLLCCVPALLVLARRAMDRQYILRVSWSLVPLAALVIWGMISLAWSADKFAALLGASHLMAALAMLYAGSQLVRSWLRLRVVAAAALGLLLALFAQSLFYRLVDLPDLKHQWSENREKFLKERGLADDPFLAQQFEQRVLAGELMGFFVSPNTMGAVVVLLALVSIGLLAQRAADLKKGTGVIFALAALPIPFSLWMIYHTRSRTALATPLLAIALLLLAWLKRDWLAAHAKKAFLAALAGGGLVAVAVIGHGLYHKTLFHESLTFRWVYWSGAMNIVKAYPITGVGLDNFGLHYLAARLPTAPEEIKDPHNLVVKMMTELGIVGALLLLAWLGRLAWEATRPVVPPAGQEQATPPYRGAKVILTFVFIASIGLVINLFCSVDYGADALYALNETLRKVILFAALMLAAALAALTSLRDPALDGRPAPLLLYALLVGLGIFLLHNLIDFSLFETGPMMLFALLAGSVLGVRHPSVAGKKRNTPAAAAALGAAAIAFLLFAGFVYIPTATAEDAAESARLALNTRRPMEASRLLDQAYTHQPLNADYAYRSAAIWIGSSETFSNAPLERLGQAIKTNPLEPLYYLTRARYLLRAPNFKENAAQIHADFTRALDLNPHDAPLQVEYADALAQLGQPAEARQRYQRAIDINNALKPNEPKKLQFNKRLDEINRKMQQLSN